MAGLNHHFIYLKFRDSSNLLSNCKAKIFKQISNTINLIYDWYALIFYFLVVEDRLHHRQTGGCLEVALLLFRSCHYLHYHHSQLRYSPAELGAVRPQSKNTPTYHIQSKCPGQLQFINKITKK